MFRLALVVLLIGGLWAEPSVYGGSSSSSRQVKRNKSAIYRLKQETARLREEIDGLRSIIEGLSQTVRRLKGKSGSKDAQRIDAITYTLDKINQNYVTKKELSAALKSAKVTSKPRAHIIERKKPNEKKSDNRLSSASSSALYSKGVRLVNKKRYSDAKLRFDILLSRGYKKAATRFYLGEIAYRTGKYSNAIDNYKTSAELDDNAGYMDKLLLHTGISMEKNGDKSQAKRFFQAIVDGFPDTTSAKVAKKHL